MSRSFLTAIAALALSVALPGAQDAGAKQDEPFAWQRTDRYVPPDFEGFFPDDPEGGKALDALYRSRAARSHSDQEILETVRRGLRRTSEHRTLVLSWIGNQYIWGKSPQDPYAVEIMYHAAQLDDPYGTRHYAVYFGLSVLDHKTDNVLRTLLELYLAGADRGRILWGLRQDRDERQRMAEMALEVLERQEAAPVEKVLEAYTCYEELAGRKPPRAERFQELGTFLVRFRPTPAFQPRSKRELVERFLSTFSGERALRGCEARLDRASIRGFALVRGMAGRDRLTAAIEASGEFAAGQAELLTPDLSRWLGIEPIE